MGTVGPHEIQFKLYGLSREDHGRVPARVFANKLTQLVAALEAADIVSNGKLAHSYVLAAMHMSEPTALLKEIPRQNYDEALSAIPTFNEAAEGIRVNGARIPRLAPVVEKISRLTSSASKTFAFAEVETADSMVVRIDDFLRKRSSMARKRARGEWFEGAALGSFDGTLQYVDARGALPQIKLVLSAGGYEIDGVCRKEDIDSIGTVLDHRVRVYGRAIYAASSPLPMRIEVTSIEPVKGVGDLERWRGAFKSFVAQGWEGDA